MSDPGFTRSDLCSIRAAAEQAEFAGAARCLLNADGYPLAGDGPPAPLARDVARSPAEAAFTLHHRHRHDQLWRLGGACLMPSRRSPVPAAAASRSAGLSATCWPAGTGAPPTAIPAQLMNAVPGSVLHAFGYLDRQADTGGACLVIGHRGQRAEAGQ